MAANTDTERFLSGEGRIVLAVLVLLFLLFNFIPNAAPVGLAAYLPLHTLLELAGISVAFLVFVIGWRAWLQAPPQPITVIACGFLAVAQLDTLHVLSFDGMPDLVTPSGPEKAINFWLAARAAGAVALLTAALLPWERPASSRFRMLVLTAALSLVALVAVAGLWRPDLLPATWDSGSGLTPFKVLSEYALVGLYALTSLVLWYRRASIRDIDLQSLNLAVLVTALSELYFTLYNDVTDLFSVLGHVYKIIAYHYLYRAVVAGGIDLPYRSLDAAQRELRIAAAAFDSQEAIIIADAAKRVLRTNKAFTRISGLDESAVRGKPLKSLLTDDSETVLRRAIDRSLDRHGSWRGELWLRHADGQRHRQRTGLTAVHDDAGKVTHYIADLIDTTALHKAKQQIEQLALFDPLTGLANRSHMLQKLQDSIASHLHAGQWGAVLYLDLDKFKSINDTLGHQAGDQLLVQVASKLADLDARPAFVARNGADEFLLLLEHCGSTMETAVAAGQRMADRMQAEVSGLYRINGQDYPVSGSVGITVFGDEPVDAIELLKQVDIAVNQVKALPERHVGFYDPAVALSLQATASLDRELRLALERGEFVLWYQPKVRDDGEVVGAEALVRWQHPEQGLLTPARFIPHAEVSGQIVAIEQWILTKALDQLCSWQSSQTTRHLSLNVNVTASQFHRRDFAHWLKATLLESGADPHGLILEFTESTLMADIDGTRAHIETLRPLGIRFAIDDFGTGYSSLAYLSRLPLSQIKIDQGFVAGMDKDPANIAIVRAIIEMAHALDLEVVAEGVETAAQLDFLKQEGCHVYQGYYFSQPVPPGEFPVFLRPAASNC